MLEIFNQIAYHTSRVTTRLYSTSFSLGILLLDKRFHDPIYAIYGFVRFADEIVDTFHDHDNEYLFQRFKQDTWEAIDQGISMNPILQSFQLTCREYGIDKSYIETFYRSMEMDLSKKTYTRKAFDDYVLGSAEVVGLMCLHVFCEGDKDLFKQLSPFAMRLGAAYQKINFLRDIKADFIGLERSYFPDFNIQLFDMESKLRMEEEIAADFKAGHEGIKRLPRKARLGVYISYVYYTMLFRKIRRLEPEKILESRVRISNWSKYWILMKTWFAFQLRLV
jgi:15-cis-phytoene synthase